MERLDTLEKCFPRLVSEFQALIEAKKASRSRKWILFFYLNLKQAFFFNEKESKKSKKSSKKQDENEDEDGMTSLMELYENHCTGESSDFTKSRNYYSQRNLKQLN